MPPKIITNNKFLTMNNFIILKFSETFSENSFSLKWHKDIDNPSCDLTFDIAHVTFPDVKGNNQ